MTSTALPSLGEVRRGLYTAGTRIRWETIAEWMRGESTIHGRLCHGGGAEATRRNEAAYVAHVAALALSPELLARASRDEVLALRRKLAEWRCHERGTLRYRAALAPAHDVLVRLLEERDALLRRLDDEPEGPRLHRTAMIVAGRAPLTFRTDRPFPDHGRGWREHVLRTGVVTFSVFSTSDEHAGRLVFREERVVLRPGHLVLTGCKETGPSFVGLCGEGSTVTRLRYGRFVVDFAWWQDHRPDVLAAVAALRRHVHGEQAVPA